jgi:ParB-like chromosome segregation protein Spo0J
MIENVSISLIKTNPKNPRVIKDYKFQQLVKSIQEFPEMLDLRPIVVNEEFMVLGGNMRLRACKEAGLKVIPIIKASNLTEEQQKEFILKDNVSFGEWDWQILKDQDQWDTTDFSDWGIDLPESIDYEPMLAPTIDTTAVTRDEIEKKAKELAEQMIKDRTFEEVICPTCGEEFSVEK